MALFEGWHPGQVGAACGPEVARTRMRCVAWCCLAQVIGPVAELSRIWRVLTIHELRRTPRVVAFFDFIVGEIDTLRPIITG